MAFSEIVRTIQALFISVQMENQDNKIIQLDPKGSRKVTQEQGGRVFISPLLNRRITSLFDTDTRFSGSIIKHGDVNAPAHIAKLSSSKRSLSTELATDADVLPAIRGFLVSYDRCDAGEYYILREGRWIVTSNDRASGANYIVIGDPSISENHAMIRIHKHGDVELVDQFSEHGTALLRSKNQEEVLLSAVALLSHGDRLRFGKRHFTVCLVPG